MALDSFRLSMAPYTMREKTGFDGTGGGGGVEKAEGGASNSV
jgi:hypothetical protein